MEARCKRLPLFKRGKFTDLLNRSAASLIIRARKDLSMPSPVVGLHHVTAIASNPQPNLDFYTGMMGLRFVKRTVNFDDPGSYHLYFGDDGGAPGTILTFFPWPSASRCHAGAGEVARTSFSVPLGRSTSGNSICSQMACSWSVPAGVSNTTCLRFQIPTA